MFKIIILGLSLFILVFNVLAHTSGQSVERDVGNYIVDIGFDEMLEAGKAARFDLNLWDTQKIEQIKYDRIWVRIAPSEGIVLATYITAPSFGLAGMSYSFPRAGEYEITVRFERGDTPLAEVIFPVTVGGHDIKITSYAIVGAISLIIGFALSFLLKKRNSAV